MVTRLPSAAQLAQQLRRRETTAVQIVETCLAQIRTFEPQIQAWVLVDEPGARAAAERADALLHSGVDLGPLHGLPAGIKDIIDVAGWPTRAGSPTRQEHVAQTDAEVVTTLRRAGAILLGKTVTTEFACFDPPPTRNPWDLARTPGGSSSGSAAALALDMVALTLGSQTGGSILRPAAFCGVCGLKPTRGAISTRGVVPISVYLDHVGPLARSVEELQLVWSVLAGPQAKWGPPFTDRSRPPLRPLFDFYLAESHPEVQQTFKDALAIWGAAEAAPLELPPSFAHVHEHHRTIMAAGAAQVHEPVYATQRAAFGPHVSALIEHGRSLSAVQLAAALEHQRAFFHSMHGVFADHWIAVMPATATAAPPRKTTGDPRFQSPWSYCGFPAVTLPCGVTAEGLPIGLQLVGPPGREDYLLQAARWCEGKIGWQHRPATTPA